MEHYSAYTMDKLLRPEGFECSCGKHHVASRLRKVMIGEKTVLQLPAALRELTDGMPLIVSDENTEKAAGALVKQTLKAAGIAYEDYILRGEIVEPDELRLGQLMMAYSGKCSCIIAVGSGVISDICKVFARMAGIRQITVGTAPSMDGYASTCASMLIGGLKTSLYVQTPDVIIADTDILKNAPMRMIQAGLGDMITKFISLPEWKMANMLHDEYWCEETSQLVARSAEMCFEAAPKLKDRDPEAIRLLIEGLILSGIGVSFVGVSGPASGGEHYVSHIWDMQNMEHHRKLELHGIQTGVNTLVMLKMYAHMKQLMPDAGKAKAFAADFDRKKWENDLRRLFGAGAQKALENEEKAGKHDPAKHAKQLERIMNCWDELLGMIRKMPSAEEAAALWGQTGAPTTHTAIGFTDEQLTDAFAMSPEIRDRYVGTRLCWDLGWIEEAKGWILE